MNGILRLLALAAFVIATILDIGHQYFYAGLSKDVTIVCAYIILIRSAPKLTASPADKEMPDDRPSNTAPCS